MDGTRVADLDSVTAEDTFLFRVRSVDGAAVASGEAALQSDEDAAGGVEGDDGIAMPDDMQSDDDVREAILLRLGGEDGETEPSRNGDRGEAVVCWLNYCQHMTHIKLDKGTGAPVRDGEVICANHGALFAADSGECTYGPCEGAFLNEVSVTVEDGGVYLTDDEYEYVGEGPVESDDDDLSSSSNVIL